MHLGLGVDRIDHPGGGQEKAEAQRDLGRGGQAQGRADEIRIVPHREVVRRHADRHLDRAAIAALAVKHHRHQKAHEMRHVAGEDLGLDRLVTIRPAEIAQLVQRRRARGGGGRTCRNGRSKLRGAVLRRSCGRCCTGQRQRSGEKRERQQGSEHPMGPCNLRQRVRWHTGLPLAAPVGFLRSRPRPVRAPVLRPCRCALLPDWRPLAHGGRAPSSTHCARHSPARFRGSTRRQDARRFVTDLIAGSCGTRQAAGLTHWQDAAHRPPEARQGRSVPALAPVVAGESGLTRGCMLGESGRRLWCRAGGRS